MSSEEKNRLVRAIAPTLKKHGFKKKGATWHRFGRDVVQTLNVQGSQWCKAFYLNLGIYIRALGARIDPPEFECHVRIRGEKLLEDADHYHRLLDFEVDVPDEVRFREIFDFIEVHAIPWLEEFSETSRIAAAMSGRQGPRLLVAPDVYGFLGIAVVRRPKRD